MFEFDEVQQLRDDVLIERLTRSVRQDRRSTVRLLVEMGEVHARGLYRDLGFSTMFEFATRRLGMSEAEAWLRTRVAKLAREVPDVLEMLARGEVTLSTLALLATHLSPGNLELLHAARFKSKREVEVLLAIRFPKPDSPDSVRRLASARFSAADSGCQSSSPGPETPASRGETAALPSCAPRGTPAARSSASPLFSTIAANMAQSNANTHAMMQPTNAITPPLTASFTMAGAPGQTAGWVDPAVGGAVVSAVVTTQARAQPLVRASTTSSVPAGPSRAFEHTSTTKPVVPLSEGRYKISFTGSQRVCDLLREAQDLRLHRDQPGDLEPLFERALELLVAEEKKRKFALTPQPRSVVTTKRSNESAPHTPNAVQRSFARTPHPTAADAEKRSKPRTRYIPNAVRREVMSRQGVQCCFVAPDGQRCQARGWLQFNHVVPFARGGWSDARNIELLCQAHNLLQAERDYGIGFMRLRMAGREAASSGSSGKGSRLTRARTRLDSAQDAGALHQARAP